jgi:hypothetical protein
MVTTAYVPQDFGDSSTSYVDTEFDNDEPESGEDEEEKYTGRTRACIKSDELPGC